MGRQWSTFILRMKVGPQEKGMDRCGKFNYLDQVFDNTPPRYYQTAFFNLRRKFIVKLIPVAMSFRHHVIPYPRFMRLVSGEGNRPLDYFALPITHAHRP